MLLVLGKIHWLSLSFSFLIYLEMRQMIKWGELTCLICLIQFCIQLSATRLPLSKTKFWVNGLVNSSCYQYFPSSGLMESQAISDLRSLAPGLRGGSIQFSSVAQSCPTLCNPMNHHTPGLPVHHQLPEFTQTHVHRVSDAIQPSHPLLSPSPPAPNPSQHQGLFLDVKSQPFA